MYTISIDNEKFSALISFLRENDKFILTTHETPDGDAIGSEIGFFELLKQLGKKVRIINADPGGIRYEFLDSPGDIEILSDTTILPEDIGEWNLIILDTNDISNIGGVSKRVLPLVREYYIIDHHEKTENIIPTNHVEKNASSTSEILFELYQAMGQPLSLRAARGLYVGIVFDTGSFIYPKTTAKTLAIAAELVALGVFPNQIYSHVYESNSTSSLILSSRVLGTLELWCDKHVAVQTMTKEMIVECNANYYEADTIINLPLKSYAIRASVFFKENLEGILRCSMRSKGKIDVASIAHEFGGGGHLTAAGFKCQESLEEIKTKVLDRLKIHFE